MSQLPLPIRLAAGLAAVALERARTLPQEVTEWPMTAVSTALQLSMRVQQRITELAIKGDEALAGLREPEEDPPWAVFDEDLPAPTYLRPPGGTDGSWGATADVGAADEQDWFDALDEVYERGPTGAPEVADDVPPAAGGPDALPSYPELTLASVRARLRRLSEADLEELLTYERATGDRPEFVRMLSNRIATVRGT